jgi:hypothetical protein
VLLTKENHASSFSILFAGNSLFPTVLEQSILPIMAKTYVIAWKSKSRGSTGHGRTLFTCEEAAQLAGELNQDHPDFHHEPLNLDPHVTESTIVELPGAATPFDDTPAISLLLPEEAVA